MVTKFNSYPNAFTKDELEAAIRAAEKRVYERKNNFIEAAKDKKKMDDAIVNTIAQFFAGLDTSNGE